MPTTPLIRMPRRAPGCFLLPGVFAAVAFGLLLLLDMSLSGCGSSVVPSFGAISVTDASGSLAGQLASVAVGTQAAVSVAVSKDAENLGVNWTATCAGSPITPPAANPCGTIAPAYVGSTNSIVYTAPIYIPVGSTVTLTARATSDPSVSSSITLTIAPRPITITFTMLPPAQIGVSGTAILSATVTNDAVAAGVSYKATCGSTNCGTFQSGLPNANQTASSGQITYTAPASVPAGPITVTASSISDPTKTVSATVTVVPITVTLAPSTVTVPLGTTASLVAKVAFDSANLGLDWSAPTCGAPGACGSLSATHTASGAANVYTPPAAIPAGGTVSVTAASTASPTNKAVVVITIVPPPPIAVTVAPATASAQINGSANLTATVANDQASAGVDWTLTCGSPGACGSLPAHTASAAATGYLAPAAIPAGGSVTATATSTTDPTKSASSIITIVPTLSLAFTPAPPTSITAGVAASFTVTNDVAGAGVDWTASCASAPCGTFASGNAAAPSHTASGGAISFTAPANAPAGSVTITATSTASKSALPIRSVATTVSVVPVISVNFIPYAPSQLQVSDGTLVTPPPVKLLAGVANDSTNAGIDWSVCTNVTACGEFQLTPALPATATTAAANATYAATVHTASGQAALYVPPSTAPTGGSVTVTAKAHNPAATSALATATAAISIVAAPTGVALQGIVLAGATPVVGAQVYLYAAGTTGYSSAASPLTLAGNAASAVTGSAGTFTIPSGYTCPQQSSEMYLVALAGKPGTSANPNLALMTALGPCNSLSSAVNLRINETTTVASVYALAPFASDYAHVGSSASNATTGLANAFASVNNLVNITTGQVLSVTPAGNGVVPQAEINTLANILNTCTASSGGMVGDGSACGALFNAANPGNITANAPVNTLQAALEVAQVPSYNTAPGPGTLYSLAPPTGPFSPVLSGYPNDWTVALSYTGGGLATRSAANSLAIDAAGDVWLTNSRFSSVTVLTNMGAPLSPFATGTGNTQATAGGYQGNGIVFPNAIAIDPFGNAWIANSGSLSELPANLLSTYSGTLSGSAFTGGGLSGTVKGLSIDGMGNLWAVSGGAPGALSWFAGANTTLNGATMAPGTPLSPASGFTKGINTPSGAIGVDTAGTVWLLNSGDNSAAEYNSSNGSFLQQDYGYAQVTPMPINSVLSSGVGTQLTIDNPGNVYLSASGQLIDLKAGGSSASSGGLGTASPANGDIYSQFLALDGAGHFFLLITGGSNNCVSSTSVVELSASGVQQNVNATGCGYLGTGINANDVGLAVDGAGNLWVLNSGSMTEFIGVAAPVVAPFSLGVANKTLATKP